MALFGQDIGFRDPSGSRALPLSNRVRSKLIDEPWSHDRFPYLVSSIHFICLIISLANSLHFTFVAPSMSRAKS